MKNKKLTAKKKSRLQKQLDIMKAKPTVVGGRVTIGCVGSFKKKYKELCRRNEDFSMLMKPNYTKLDVKGGGVYTYNKRGFNYGFMSMLSQIKSDIKANVKRMGGVEKLPVYTHRNIRYCFYGKNLTGMGIPERGDVVRFTDAVEYDISKAYFQAAHKLGYISDNIYEMCCDGKIVPKKDRLRLLGAIATQGELFVFRNGKEVSHKTIANEVMRRVWFHICKVVDNCMMEFVHAIGDSLYMFWVDGIVFKKQALNTAKSFVLYAMVKYDFDFKKVSVDKVEVCHNKDGRLCIYVWKEGVKKEFMFPSRKNKQL